MAEQTAKPTARGFDLQRFGQEVASEIGIDPNNLEAYGLSADKIRELETQTHSRGRQGARRR